MCGGGHSSKSCNNRSGAIVGLHRSYRGRLQVRLRRGRRSKVALTGSLGVQQPLDDQTLLRHIGGIKQGVAASKQL